MDTITQLDRMTVNEQDSESLKSLLKFLESPNSIGIDGLREYLRNTVKLMIELKGEGTGLTVEHLAHGEHDSMGLNGSDFKGKKKRKKKTLAEMIDHLRSILEDFSPSFQNVFEHVESKISSLKEEIKDEIAEIDAEIEQKTDDPLKIAALKASNTKRAKLVALKERVKAREEKLKSTKKTIDVIDIEARVEKDLEDFKNDKNLYNDIHAPSMLNPLRSALASAAPLSGAKKAPDYKPGSEGYPYQMPNHDYGHADNHASGGADEGGQDSHEQHNLSAA